MGCGVLLGQGGEMGTSWCLSSVACGAWGQAVTLQARPLAWDSPMRGLGDPCAGSLGGADYWYTRLRWSAGAGPE